MATGSKTAKWIGYGLSGLFVLFMLFDSLIKLPPLDIVITTLTEIGYPASPALARGLGILALICTGLYTYPRTSLLGAVLMTGYLGGAMATHLRLGSPVFSHLLFGLYLGLFMWGGLYLRDERLRALFPIRR